MDAQPLRFIDEPIEVDFDQPPVFEKRPECPDAFTWRGELYRVAEVLSEWRDYGRRGRMANNMRPEHAELAAERGSWGVGRFYLSRPHRCRADLRSLLRPRAQGHGQPQGRVVPLPGNGAGLAAP